MDVLAHDAKGPGLWLPCFQADDDVVPARIGSLGDVGAAGVCLGMGMAMSAANDFQTIGFRSQFGTKVLFRVNRVDHRAVGDIGAGHKPNYFRGCGVSY
ncbi:MAG: hypothetical protein RL114_1554 [Actinomycetota bacterium]